MNEEIQPKQKKRGRPRKIQQQSLSSDKTVSPEVEKEIRSKMVNVEGGQWQCVDCSYTSKFNNVHKHVEAKHVTEKNSYECPICHRVKNGLNSFSNHIYRFHKNEKSKESLQETGGGPEKKKKITEVKEQKAGSKSGGRRKTAAAKSGGRTKKAPKKSGKTVKISVTSEEPKLIVRNKELQAHNEVSESEEGDRSRELEEPPASADTVWPVLINGRTVWVELDNKPSPKVRPTGLQNYSSIL